MYSFCLTGFIRFSKFHFRKYSSIYYIWKSANQILVLAFQAILVHYLDEVDGSQDIDNGDVAQTEIEVDKNRNVTGFLRIEDFTVKGFLKTGLIKETYLVVIDVNVVEGTVVEVEIVDSVVYVEKVGLDVDNELKNKNTKYGNEKTALQRFPKKSSYASGIIVKMF